jgi:uncharacterized protein
MSRSHECERCTHECVRHIPGAVAGSGKIETMRDAAGDAATIGLISDTHGLMRPEALAALKGCDLIIHAGDVGKPEIIEQLLTVAPVVAVRGNIDNGAWAAQLPLTAVAETRWARIYVLHDLQQLDLDPAAAELHIVVSGHSHQASRAERAGVLYLNPGSAGPRRFQLPITVARLDLRHSPWSIDFIDLSDGETYCPPGVVAPG